MTPTTRSRLAEAAAILFLAATVAVVCRRLDVAAGLTTLGLAFLAAASA